MTTVHWLAIADLQEKKNLIRELRCERCEWYDVLDTSEDEDEREMARNAIEGLTREIERVEKSL